MVKLPNGGNLDTISYVDPGWKCVNVEPGIYAVVYTKNVVRVSGRGVCILVTKSRVVLNGKEIVPVYPM